MNITTAGIDLAKNIFHLHGVDARGKVVLQKRLTRRRVSAFMANLPRCRVGMESCSGAHYWHRVFCSCGVRHRNI
jgi:transposase